MPHQARQRDTAGGQPADTHEVDAGNFTIYKSESCGFQVTRLGDLGVLKRLLQTPLLDPPQSLCRLALEEEELLTYGLVQQVFA